MSLFRALTGDFDDDPTMALQRFAMGSMFTDPFEMMGGHPAHSGPRQRPRGPFDNLSMMPFGFPSAFPMPSINPNIFPAFGNLQENGNCHSFSSTSVMTMTNGPDGKPQVYQESTSTRMAPGGIKETKKTVCDSRTGTKQMAIGHHIGDRAHILERKQDLRSGEEEENQEFINLDEEEAETFNKEWETRTRRSMGAIAGPGSSHKRHPKQRHLALPSSSSSRQSSGHSRWLPSPRKVVRKLTFCSQKKTVKNSSSSSTCSTGRKRGHTPEVEEITPPKRKVAERSDD